MRISVPLLAVCFLFSGLESIACAVNNVEIALVTDGSAEPPGDRIDIAAYFEVDQTRMQVQVRGFVISGENNEIVKPLNQGASIVSQLVERREDSPTARASVVIPFEQLGLSKGGYQIAYEITGIVDGKVVFVRPTPLTFVVVSDETRRQITIVETIVGQEFVDRFQKIVVAGKPVRGEPAKPEFKDTIVKTPVTTKRKISKVAQTEIPGGFIRSIDDRKRPTAIESKKQKPDVSDVKSLENQQWQSLSEVQSENDRIIWFSTNRGDSETQNNGKRFGATIAKECRYGSCVVNVPIQSHRKGTLQAPSWWTKRDPKRHFIINGLAIAEKFEFIKQFGERDIFLFIHGFNNSFSEAIFRTAQLQHDLDFGGQSIAFCWPSMGELGEYETDQKNADASVEALANTILTLSRSLKQNSKPDSVKGSPRLHILAHSMGNRVLVQALYQLNLRHGSEFIDSPIGQIILAAPDVGAIMFNNFSPHAVDLGQQVTYYYCETDAALNVSRELNKYEPVGLMPYFDDGLSTISANGQGTSFIAHNYYASSRSVLADIELMLKEGKTPPQRMPPLAAEIEVFGHRSWAFSDKQRSKRKK